MKTYKYPQAKCLIFTYKEGLLSAVAHDLKLDVEELSISFDPENLILKGTANPTSVRVICAMKNGQEAPSTLSAKDKKEIEKNILKDVLQPKKYPSLSFSSSNITPHNGSFTVSGTLDLHGIQRNISFDLIEKEGHYHAEMKLDQRDFKIKPFSAMFGTLKIQPTILIKISFPSE